MILIPFLDSKIILQKKIKSWHLFLWVCALCFLFFSSAVYSQIDISKLTEQQLLEQAKIYEDAGEKRNASQMINEVATRRWEKKDYKKAIEHFKYSLKLNEGINNINGIMGICSNLAMLYADLEDYPTSEQYFRKTLEGRLQGNDKVSIIAGRINLSVVLNKQGKYDESAKHLKEALSLALEMNDVKQMASCYGMLAETYEKAGNPKQMLYYFDLFKTFHGKTQENKLKNATRETEELRLKTELLQANEKIKDLELATQEKKIGVQESKIQKYTREVEELLTKNSAADLAQNILAQKYEMEQLKLKDTESKVDRQRILLLSALIIAILLLSLAIIAFRSASGRKKRNEILRARNKKISEQNEKIKIQNQKLEDAYLEVDRSLKTVLDLSDFKETMTHMLVHDLKNPMNAIIGLSQNYDGNSKLRSIHFAGRQLLSMTTNMLDIQKFETVGVELVKGKRNIAHLTAEACRQTETLVESKNINLKIDVDYTHCVQADEDLLLRVLINLITNAIKYTPINGQIIVNTQIVNGKLKINISDNGPGVPKDKWDVIFEKYGQADAQKSGVANSTGLGLTFCKMVIEAHQGSIEISNASIGGAQFTVTLPEASIDQQAISPNPETQEAQTQNVLSVNDLATLKPYKKRLQNLDYYEVTDILQEISDLESHPQTAIKNWYQQLRTAIFASNEEAYKQMIS